METNESNKTTNSNLNPVPTTDATANPAENSLNTFLIFVMMVGILGTVIRNFSECYKFFIWNTDHIAVFCITALLFATIHITAILIILIKKSILGYYIMVGNFFLSFIICPIINTIVDYQIFDVEVIITKGIIQIIAITLLLFLRSNGKSAWKVLLNKTNKIDNPAEKGPETL